MAEILLLSPISYSCSCSYSYSYSYSYSDRQGHRSFANSLLKNANTSTMRQRVRQKLGRFVEYDPLARAASLYFNRLLTEQKLKRPPPSSQMAWRKIEGRVRVGVRVRVGECRVYCPQQRRKKRDRTIHRWRSSAWIRVHLRSAAFRTPFTHAETVGNTRTGPSWRRWRRCSCRGGRTPGSQRRDRACPESPG